MKTERKAFYNVNIVDALGKAESFVGKKGKVLSLPELIDLRLKEPFSSEIWTRYYDSVTEEVVCTINGKPKVILVDRGVLTSQRITKARQEGLVQWSAKLTDKEISLLAKRKDAIVLDFDAMKRTESGYQEIGKLYDNPLFIARAGGKKRAKAYLDRCKENGWTKLGNWHRFNNCDPNVPSARLLCLYGGIGVGTGRLYGDGRFVGVRPSSKKRKTCPHCGEALS